MKWTSWRVDGSCRPLFVSEKQVEFMVISVIRSCIPIVFKQADIFFHPESTQIELLKRLQRVLSVNYIVQGNKNAYH